MSKTYLAAVVVIGVLGGVAIGLFTGRKNPPNGVTKVNQGESQRPAMSAAPRMPTRIEYNLPVLGVHQDVSGKDIGSCTFFPMSIACTGSDAPLRVSFSEDVPSGTGDTIRNSLWTAALVAALQKESQLQGVVISLGFSGRYDGPSAGAVMCLAIMSALDKRPFPDDFAMTGALLPDGTIGLVGGVVEKLTAAAENPKIKRAAIPAFQRFVRTVDGKWVDLFEYGKSLGLELRPVESISDAYLFMHRVNKVTGPRLSSILDCMEDSQLENSAAKIFANRYIALRARVSGLSSNEYEMVRNDDDWNAINPEVAESRFEEGAIFDALALITWADASLSAFLDSSRFYDKYVDDFMKREDVATGNSGQSLSEKFLEDWPVEKQVALVGGFRERALAFMEQDLGQGSNGWHSCGLYQNMPATNEGKKWGGFIPIGSSSDIEAQFRSVLMGERRMACYRDMRDNLPDRIVFKGDIEQGNRNIGDEFRACREKLNNYIFEQQTKPCFADVSLPIQNAGPGMDATLFLFRNAWAVVDKTFDAEVIDAVAEASGVHKDAVRSNLISQNIYYSTYEASKNRVRHLLRLYDEADQMAYPSWTKSCLLFNVAELLAESSTLLFEQDFKNGNANYVAFAIGRARTSALLSIHTCHKYGIPCFGPVSLFQKAERLRAINDRNSAEILAAYWKATMISKALVMAFRGGPNPENGFNGYSVQKQADSRTDPPASNG
jgi:hypothetical protein